MYLEIFLADFAVFRGSATARNIRSPVLSFHYAQRFYSSRYSQSHTRLRSTANESLTNVRQLTPRQYLQSTPKSRLTYSTIVALVLDFLIQSINAISIALIEELKDALKKDTIYDSEQSMEVKSDNLPGLTSSTKPHSAEWTP